MFGLGKGSVRTVGDALSLIYLRNGEQDAFLESFSETCIHEANDNMGSHVNIQWAS